MHKLWQQLFTEHPRSVNETYFQHMGQAGYFAGVMFLASIACLLHALLPAAFERTGSKAITHLYDRMVQNRVRQRGAEATRVVQRRSPRESEAVL